MYRFATCLMLAALLSSVAGATTTITTDGLWWAALSDGDKAVIILASTNAYQAGWEIREVEAAVQDSSSWMSEASRFQDSAAQTSARFAWRYKFQKNHKVALPSFNAKKIGAYIDRVNQFYSTYPNSETLEFGYVLTCIADRPLKTCDQVAKDGF